MNKNLSNSQLKKIAIQTIGQASLESQKPQRKAEIANILGIDSNCNASPTYFRDQIGDWVATNYEALKNNLNDFFQNGNLKSLSKQSKDILSKLIKKIIRRVNEFESIANVQPSPMPIKNTMMSYPPVNYVYPPAPAYMMPPAPNMMGGNFSEQKQNYDNYLQQYYMSFTKYGYPMNQYYMPQMPSMEIPKYPDSQNPENLKNPPSPYYPYQLHPSTHSQSFNGYPIHPSIYMGPHMMPPPTSSTSLQGNPSVQKPAKIKNTQQQHNKVSKQNGSTRLVEDADEIFRRYQQMYGKQLPKNAPFLIVPPSMLKIQRPQIPQSLNKSSAQTLNESSQILIVQKNVQIMNDIAKQKAKNKKLPSNKIKNMVPQAPTRPSSQTVQQNNFQLLLNQEYKDQFKNCLCKGHGASREAFTCSECKKMYHYACSSKKIPYMLIKDQIKKQICHFCYMMDLDPLNKVEGVIKTSYLIDIRHNKFHQFFDFQAFDSYAGKNSPFEIELRCMRMEDASNGVPEYTWPDQCLILINDDKAFQFQALQHNSSLKKRKDMSIFLTSYIYHYSKHYSQRKNIPITLQIKQSTTLEMNQKKIRNGYVFIFGVYLTKKKTPQELTEQIMNDPTNKVSFAQQFFSQPSEEEDIQIQQIKVNLLDPFTWNLIDIPARGRKCIHGQCFDLKTFLSFMNVQKVRQWKCPVCNRECRHFLIDTQQLQAIKEFVKQESNGKAQKLSRQISFHRDGRTLFVLQNDQDDLDQDKNANIIDPTKNKLTTKDQRQSL